MHERRVWWTKAGPTELEVGPGVYRAVGESKLTPLLDEASIEAIARRVVELLGNKGKTDEGELISAAELAQRLGVERSWVYANARQLGAVRLGVGSRPRLRFDAARARAALTLEAGPVAIGRARRTRRPRATPVQLPPDVELLRGRREGAKGV